MKPSFFFIFPLFILLVACSGQTEIATQQADAQPITLQLSWVHEYSSSLLHAAVKEGYFAANGLDITLQEGGFGENGFIDPVSQVIDGKADFGFGDAFEIIQARNDGKPIVGVASVLQRSPTAIMSLADAEIFRPQDLSGHSVTIAEGGAMMLYDTLMDMQGVDTDSVTVIPRLVFGVDSILNREVDSLLGWITNEGVALEEAGESPNFILLSDYGIDTYNFVLFTTQDMVDNHPETVQAMVNAIAQGIDFVVENPQEAITHTHEFAPDLDADAQLRRLQASIPLMNVPGVVHASMDANVWEFSADLLRERGLIADDFDVSTVFTLDFTISE